MDKEDKINDLAYRIMENSRNQLLFQYRFLELALYRLNWQNNDNLCMMGTDGSYYYFYDRAVLKAYMVNPESVEDTLLHMVLHCIFLHPYYATEKEMDYWSLASDVMVAFVMRDLKRDISIEGERFLDLFEKEIKAVSAQSIYRYFIETEAAAYGIFGQPFAHVVQIFQRDDHSLWWCWQQEEASKPDVNAKITSIIEEWKDVAERMEIELENFMQRWGEQAQHLVQNLREVTKDEVDYTEFLRKFAVMQEEMRVNQDEFDYVFYTYGLKLYKKVLLIEPLEYKESYLIKDFVVAIDTSGSCSGEVVQQFLEKTYSILKSTENFATKVNIHIIQCDAEIQKHDVITSLAELDHYIRDLQLFGFGGTDFRPVFAYVDSLIAKHAFSNLGGLIYFTDGYGTFPKKPAKYKTAFVFVNQQEIPKVPPWVIKTVWNKEAIVCSGTLNRRTGQYEH